MFHFFKRDCLIYAPVNGECVSLEEVPDQVFASKLLGDGVAFQFEGDTIYAPCDGRIVMIASTKHALGIQSKDGVEIMLHIGLETVNLNGKGFKLYVGKDQRIKKGKPLLSLDRRFFDEEEVNLITPMVITSKNCNVEVLKYGEVDRTTPIIKVS